MLVRRMCILTGFAGLSAVVITAVVAHAVLPKQGPRLKLATEMIHVSTRGPVAEAVLAIKNNGQQNLVIERVQSSCGCLKAEVTKNTLAAGESTELRARVQAFPVGDRTIAVEIHSNDSDTRVRRVIIRVSRERDVPYVADLFDPLMIHSILGAGAEPTLVRFTTYEQAGQEQWVRGVKSDGVSLRATLLLEATEKTQEAQFVLRRYRVELTSNERTSAGCYTGLVELFSSKDCRGEPLGSWRVTHNVNHTLVAVPTRVRLQFNPAGPNRPARFAVVSNQFAESWDIESVQANNPCLEVKEISSSTGGQRARLFEVAFLDPPTDTPAQTEILIKTTSRSSPELRVQVSLSLKDTAPDRPGGTDGGEETVCHWLR